jgi:hypothetical protein
LDKQKKQRLLLLRAGFKIFIPVPPKPLYQLNTAKATDNTYHPNGISTGIIIGINKPVTK